MELKKRSSRHSSKSSCHVQIDPSRLKPQGLVVFEVDELEQIAI